jgi:hypothetical protein
MVKNSTPDPQNGKDKTVISFFLMMTKLLGIASRAFVSHIRKNFTT